MHDFSDLLDRLRRPNRSTPRNRPDVSLPPAAPHRRAAQDHCAAHNHRGAVGAVRAALRFLPWALAAILLAGAAGVARGEELASPAFRASEPAIPFNAPYVPTAAGPRTAVEPGPHANNPAALAIVRVWAGANGGSGVVIENRAGQAVVLTAAHVTQGLRTPQIVTLQHGQCAGALLWEDRAADVAAIAVKLPADLPPIPLAARAPRVGESVTSAGYGGNHVLRANSGYAVGYERTRASGEEVWLVISGGARSGDSGGPMLDAEGRVAGVLWGAGAAGPTTHGCVCTKIQQLLAAHAATSAGSCPGGSCPPPYRPHYPPRSPNGEGELPRLRPESPQASPRLPDLDNGSAARAESALKQELSQIRQRIEALAQRPLLPGPPGPPGPQGPPGKDAEAAVRELARRIEKLEAGQHELTQKQLSEEWIKSLAPHVAREISARLRVRVSELP